MLTVRPSEMLQHVPGRSWLDPVGQDGDDMAVHGFNFRPSTANIWTASHVVIVYRQAHATMKRSIGGQLHSSPVGAGDISLKNVASSGQWSWSESIDVVHVYIQPAMLDRVAAEIHGPGYGSFRLNDCVRIRDAGVAQLANAMADEAAVQRPGARLMTRSLGLQLAVQLVRSHGEVRSRLGEGGFDAARCRLVSEHIAAHLAGDLSLAALADLMGLSVDHFSRLFRAAFDCAPHRYVLRARLASARELMRDPTRTLADVAAAAGFADQSHLHRWFRREFGLTPGAWRAGAARRTH